MPESVSSIGFFPLVAIYLTAVNLLAVVLTVADKRRAARHEWRVPEKVLFLVALLGGSVLHKRFMWGLPAIFLLQLALAGWAVHLMMTHM